MVKTISVKELRTNFPKVREGLAKGITYLVIYQSMPIGQLKPVDPENLVISASSADMETASSVDVLGKEKLSAKEKKHYKSLINGK